jgi:hypothetical protein
MNRFYLEDLGLLIYLEPTATPDLDNELGKMLDEVFLCVYKNTKCQVRTVNHPDVDHPELQGFLDELGRLRARLLPNANPPEIAGPNRFAADTFDPAELDRLESILSQALDRVRQGGLGP